MSAIDFVVRSGAGNIERGLVQAGSEQTTIQGGAGREVSLNLAQSDLRGYFRDGDKLIITLADGRIVVVDDYFAADGSPATRLFLSADGALNEVTFDATGDGVLFANYGPTDAWGKWSPDDDLIFLDRPEVLSAELAAEGDNVSMLATGLLGGGGLTRLLAGGAAAGLVASQLGGGGGGDGGGGGGGGNSVVPTIDHPTTEVIIGGDNSEGDQTITVNGTGMVGSTVTVTIGGQSVDTTVGDDGTWTAVFVDDTFPDDGNHDIFVHVVDPNGDDHNLTGPNVTIDTTPPEIAFTDGVVSIGDLTNAEDYADGVEVAGTGEAGATVEVTANGVTYTTVVDVDGNWSVVFAPGELPEGELFVPVTIVTTDSYGNSTTVQDEIEIDTVPHPITINWQTVGGEGVVNAAENDAGFQVTGTTTPGAVLTITVDGYSGTATADADGNWVLNIPAGELPGGEYDVTVTATTTDAAGNASSHTETFVIDTLNAVSISTNLIEGDDIVNAAEASDGFMVTGTTSVGSSVMVTMGGVTLPATVNADGTWSVDFSAADVPPGEYDAEITVISTDAAGNTATAMRTIHVDTVNNVAIDTGVEGDDLANAAEVADGLVLTGTGDVGSTVEVTLGGVSQSAMVGADGTWSVTFAAGDVASGEYDAIATVTSTDAAGNSATAQHTFHIDTVTNVAIDVTLAGDNLVSAAEAQMGVPITGTSQPGNSIEMEFNGTTYTGVTGADGTWVITVPASGIAAGTYTTQIAVTATDAAGNQAHSNGTLDVDTENGVTVATANVEGDGVVNEVEQADGVVLTGTTEPGSTVQVTVGITTHTATVDAAGNWTATFSASEFPVGETVANVTAVSTDAAGNVATASGQVDVDTFVRNHAITSGTGGADGVINAEEAVGGMTLNGTTEPGSTLVVSFAGSTVNAVVDANGNWTATFPPGSIPAGEYSADAMATATDPAGNVAQAAMTVVVDTEAGVLEISPAPVEGDDVVNFVEASDGVTIVGTSDAGAAVEVTLAGVSRVVMTDGFGNWQANFAAGEVAQGTYLAEIVATRTDPAGNVITRTDSVQVDTVVDNFVIAGAPVEGDDVINMVEASDGVTLVGTVEVGSSVSVEFGGVTRAAVVDGSGNWIVSFSSLDIASGEYHTTATVSATDPAGNVDTRTRDVEVDTLVNDLTANDPVAGDGIINTAEAAAGVTLSGTVEQGSTVEVIFAHETAR